jgi:hypothetical protein
MGIYLSTKDRKKIQSRSDFTFLLEGIDKETPAGLKNRETCRLVV